MANIERLNAAIEIAATPPPGFKHNQGDWNTIIDFSAKTEEQCGTALCLAGFGAMLSGSKPPRPRRDYYGHWQVPLWYVLPETGETVDRFTDGGILVASYARDWFGLSHGQADALFDADNTLNGIRAMRDVLAENPEAGYDELWRAFEEVEGWNPKEDSEPDDDYYPEDFDGEDY